MKNSVQDGEYLDYTPGADVISGQMVLVGARVGVVLADIKSGETGSLHMEKVHEVPKKSADTFVFGAETYWDDTAKNITSTSSGNTKAGMCAEAAGAGATTIKIKINA